MADDSRTLGLKVDVETEVARAQLKGLADATGQTATQVDANLTRIETKVNAMADGFKTAGSLITGVVGGFLAGAVEGVADKFFEASKRALDYAGTLQKVAEQLGTTTDFLQQYRYAALQNDVSSEKADTALAKFNKTVGQAAIGNSRAITTFKALNVDILDANGNIKPLRENFLSTAEGISKIVSPSEQAARATQAFSREGYELLPLLRQGAAGFLEYAAAAGKLGIVLSPEQIENAARAEQKFNAIKEVLSVEFAAAITSNADALLDLARGFEEAASAAVKYGAAHSGLVANGTIVLGGTAVGSMFGPVGAGIGSVISLEIAAYRANNNKSLLRQGGDIIAERAGGGAVGYAAKLAASNDDRIAIALAASPVGIKASALSEINALPLGSAARTQAETEYRTRYKQDPAPPANKAPVNDQAQHVLDTLNSKADAGGDPRQLAINSALSSAGVDADSIYGKQIVAAAGQVYDSGPGKRAAETAARNTASEATRTENERMRAVRVDAAGDRDVDRAARSFRTAQANAAGTPEARFALQSGNIDESLGDKLSEISDNGPSGTKRYSALQAKNLAALATATAAQEHIALDKQEEERKLQEQLGLQLSDLSNAQDQAQAVLALADTAAERRVIELRLLDLQLAEERAREDAVIASESSTKAEKEIARRRLASIDATEGAKRENVNRDTEGPLASYARSVNKTTAQMNEALQGVEVDGLKGLEDGLVGIITGTESVGEAFKKMADTIISDLLRIAIEKAIIGPIANALFGGGSLFGGGFAEGGVPPPGKISLVGENGPEYIVGNGTARVVPMSPASPRAVSAGGSSAGNVTYLNIDARGSTDPAAVEAAARRAVLGAAPALNSGIKAGTIAQLKRPILPGNRS